MPVFESPWHEYRWIRTQLGYPEDAGLAQNVWCDCTEESQQNMLQQMRDALAHHDRYVEAYGEVW